ncbi:MULTISPECIES: LysR substrate-binding domain-containing protein [Pseudoalteromonas]|uniref:LysR family transcriptional regulator n=1 Tax=Pseudoalteromonas porphyrae TaxID=187330 RepID=A0A0N0M1R4_9GAMM|nr:LysR substrate-binding domain-containing protein [Pseudoalteromonas porphyrae]KPH65531.1 LysR family transcriptional regulator [Pseudoalteromonas porphyrae]NMR26137.1 LysR family transcriptional regulator [Pseudoalteromonas sp. NEC-BIFX-2020_015]
MNLPPLKSLWYFKHAAELGSFKLAAEKLFVSQAAVSQQIRLLEANLQCELFTRHTRFVALTRQGEQLLPHVLKGFSCLQNGVNSLRQDEQPHCLNLSVLPSFASGWLLQHVSGFQRAYPGIHLRIDPSDHHANFSQGHVDLGIRFGLGNYSDVHSELLADDSLFLAYKPGLLDVNLPLKEQLLKQNIIMDICPDAEQGWQTLITSLGVCPASVPVFLEIDNAALVIQATLAGQGIALVRRRLIESHIKLGQLALFPGFEYACSYKYYLVGPKDHFKWEKVIAFKEWLLSQFKQDDEAFKPYL